jgi:hypothetical protein
MLQFCGKKVLLATVSQACAQEMTVRFFVDVSKFNPPFKYMVYHTPNKATHFLQFHCDAAANLSRRLLTMLGKLMTPNKITLERLQIERFSLHTNSIISK